MADTHDDPDAATETLRDERTPLLPKTGNHDVENVPLPKGQLFLVCFARLVEPVAFFSIFPFINAFVEETGIAPSKTGFYTGAIESLFSFTQFLVMPFWGKFSDKRGRKPVLVASLFGLAITSTLFGIARNVWTMMAFRIMSGIFSGSTVTLRTITSEISTPKTQATAFAGFALAGNLAISLAPLMGGLLSRPADTMPFFARLPLFVDYPYLLPCMVTGSLAFVAATVNLIFLKETRVVNSDSDQKEAPTTKELLSAEGVKSVLLINLWTFTLAFSYTALSPVFQFTPIKLGGYGFAPREISYLLGLSGGGQAMWTILFPFLHRKFGSIGIIRFASYAWPTLFVLFPSVNAALRHGLPKAAFWTISCIIAIFGSAIAMSFTSVQLCLNDISPSPAALGTLNGIALSAAAAARAIAPAAISSIFAFGVDRHILWGQLAWFILFFVAIGYNIAVRYLPRKAWGIAVVESSSSA